MSIDNIKNDNKNIIKQTSIKDFPEKYFKVIVNEISERLTIGISVCGFLDDISDLEASFGKNITKIGTHGFSLGRSDCLPNSSNIWENVHKISTVHNGKQHIALSSSIAQNLCKALPEQSKSYKKKLASISNKIFGLIDDLKKAKSVHQKNIDKYTKLVHDTEALIKASKSDNEHNELTDANMSSRNNSLDLKETKDSTKIDMMNRSLSKMLSKITSSEKNGIGRFKEQLKEMESLESQLIANNKRLLSCKEAILSEIRKAYVELEEIEMNRLNMLNDGMNSLYSYAVLLVDKKLSLLNPVFDLLIVLDMKEELKHFLSLSYPPQQNKNKLFLRFRLSSSSNDEPNPNNNNTNVTIADASTTDELGVNENELDLDEKKYDKLLKLYDKIDRMTECMEYLKTLCNRMNTITSDIATVETSYYSSQCKMIERHESLFDVSMNSNNSKDTISVARLESPSSLNGWINIFKVYKHLGETHSRNSKYYFDEICNRLNLVHRRVEIGKRDIQEKLSNRSKEIITAESNLTQANSKLTKLRNLLKERRQTLKYAIENNIDNGIAQEELLSPNNLNTSISCADDIDNDNNMEDATVAVISSNDSKDEEVTTKRKSMIKGLENFGNSLANVKFKVVVGLETATDRIQRIEKQIQSLEEEERELTDVYEAANTNLQNITEVNYKDLDIDLTATQNLMLSDLELLKSVLDSLIRTQIDALEENRTYILDVKNIIDTIDIPSDFSFLLSQIQKKSIDTNNLDSGLGLLLEIPSIDSFEPIKSILIEEEKKNLPRQSVTTFDSILDSANNKVDNTAKLSKDNNLHPINEGEDEEDSIKATKIDSFSKVSEIEGKAAVSKVSSDSNQQQNLPNSMSLAVESFKSFVNSTPSGKSVVTSAPIKEETELLKFGLASTVKVYDSFSCALYPKKGILTHGRLYITQKYLAFSGWPDTRVLLALRNIIHVERTNTLVYIPNALLIYTDDKQEYFLGSFIDRESCLSHINTLREVERKLFELHGAEAIPETEKNLEFGILNNSKTSKISTKIISNQLPSANSSIASTITIPKKGMGNGEDEVSNISVTNSDNSFGDQGDDNNTLNPSKILFPVDQTSDDTAIANKLNSGTRPSVVTFSSPAKHAATLTQKSAMTSATSIVKPVGTTKFDELSPTEGEDLDNLIDFPKLYSSSGLTLINDKVIDYSVSDIFKNCWISGNAFNEFLKDSGETEVKNSNWIENAKNPIEDITKVNFSFQRNYSFLHLRTSMLMFGPKLAPSTQVQYLYVSNMKSNDPEKLKTMKPKQFMVLLVTQLHGIPMSDVFKVLQYWSFDSVGPNNSCKVQVGMGIHFLKSSLFKSQIVNGTKDELVDQAKHWHIVVSNIMNNKIVDKNDKSVESTIEKKEIITELITQGVEKQPEGKLDEAKTQINQSNNNNSSSFNMYSIALVLFLLLVIYLQYSNNNKLWTEIKDVQKQIEQNKLVFDIYKKETREYFDKLVSTLEKSKND